MEMTLWKTNQSINQWSCINKWLLIQLNREITSIFKFCTAKWLMTWKTGSRLISVNSLPHRKSHVASGGSNKFRAAKSLNHLKYFCIKILHNVTRWSILFLFGSPMKQAVLHFSMFTVQQFLHMSWFHDVCTPCIMKTKTPLFHTTANKTFFVQTCRKPTDQWKWWST